MLPAYRGDNQPVGGVDRRADEIGQSFRNEAADFVVAAIFRVSLCTTIGVAFQIGFVPAGGRLVRIDIAMREVDRAALEPVAGHQPLDLGGLLAHLLAGALSVPRRANLASSDMSMDPAAKLKVEAT